MKKKISVLRSNLAFNIISAVVLLLFVFALIVSVIGFISFTNSFKREYSDSTFRMAQTAVTLVNGDKIESYLEGERDAEFERSGEYLDVYCTKMGVSLIYVIKVDSSDYGSFRSVFNSVDNSVDGTDYTPWETGFKRDTTNDEYRQKYKAICENGSEYETVYRTTALNGKRPHITTMVPVKNSAGEVTAILCVQRPMSELNRSRLPYLINIAVSAVVLAAVVIAVWAVYIKREFVKPIRRVTAETERFALENKKGEPLGQLSKIEEITVLARSVEQMEADMLSYIENLTSVTAEKERIGAELAIASTIQENSIPNIFPPYPDRKEFEIYASMTPAKKVGGDFYNFFLVDSDHLALVMADVSGKGIPAALFMMVSNILISDRTMMGGTPAEILSFVNSNICRTNKADMFVTVWLGILEISTGKIIAANAGHEHPAVYHKGGCFEIVKSKHSLVLGAMDNIRYNDVEIKLEKGDKLFLYTDGVSEAVDENNNMFTLSRMLDSLNSRKDESPQRILEGVKEAVDAFAGGAPQFDDLTMLCLELKDDTL